MSSSPLHTRTRVRGQHKNRSSNRDNIYASQVFVAQQQGNIKIYPRNVVSTNDSMKLHRTEHCVNSKNAF